MTATYNTPPETERPTLGAIWRAGIIAAVVATVINVILYYIGATLGWMDNSVLTPMGAPITVMPVALFTILGSIAGTVVYTILTRFRSYSRANNWFAIIASVVIIFMAFSPPQLPNPPVMMVVLLEIMHVVAGVTPIYFLTKSGG